MRIAECGIKKRQKESKLVLLTQMNSGWEVLEDERKPPAALGIDLFQFRIPNSAFRILPIRSLPFGSYPDFPRQDKKESYKTLR
jgi:hypothetical protein